MRVAGPPRPGLSDVRRCGPGDGASKRRVARIRRRVPRPGSELRRRGQIIAQSEKTDVGVGFGGGVRSAVLSRAGRGSGLELSRGSVVFAIALLLLRRPSRAGPTQGPAPLRGTHCGQRWVRSWQKGGENVAKTRRLAGIEHARCAAADETWPVHPPKLTLFPVSGKSPAPPLPGDPAAPPRGAVRAATPSPISSSGVRSGPRWSRAGSLSDPGCGR